MPEGTRQTAGGGFWGPTVHHRLTDSTNDRARELAEAGAVSGTVVVADEQTAGRGRTGRRWSAPPRAALLCSAILRPLEAHHALLPLAVPLAVCEAAEALVDVSCTVKWPNDIWIGERKVAGVLVEARFPDWAVIGVGLNLTIADDEFPSDLRWPATSLGQGIEAPAALEALRTALGRWTAAESEDVVAAFGPRDALRDRVISWVKGSDPSTRSEGSSRGAAGMGSDPLTTRSGTARGIDGRGNLVVDAEEGCRLTLGAGEVSLRL